MRFKVDENLHDDIADALRDEGYDAQTVYDQGLRGYGDRDIVEACQREQRIVVALDLDFADIREYPPEKFPGLNVLRVVNQSRAHVLRVLSQVFVLLESQPLVGRLWIVSEGGVRIRPGNPAEDT